MDKDANLNDYFNQNFWNQPNSTPVQIQVVKSPQRLRKIVRNYTAINEAQQWEPKYFQQILDSAMQKCNFPDGYKRTGRPSIPISEKLKIGIIKQYNLKCARSTVSHVESARNAGFLFVPEISKNYFNRINEYGRDELLMPHYQKLIEVISSPLAKKEKYFAIDGTGFKTSFGKRNYRQIRTNIKQKREYIGLHAVAGIQSKIIPCAIVSRGYEHDSKFFEPLVSRAKELSDMEEIYADSAYLTEEIIQLCHKLNIKPFIKPKQSTLVYKFNNPVWTKAINNFIKDLDKKENRRYTLRNNIEATFWMVKSIFNDNLRDRTFAGRVNEVLARVVCHDIRCLVYAYVKRDIKFPFEND